ncbi:MAG: hypothetical protein ABIG42_05090, partial [bacterium]
CGIIPFLRNELTKYVNPVKAYEYLAGGVGVVGTPLDEYNYFDNNVLQAGNAENFIRAIEQIMKQNYLEARKKRMDFAKEQDWNVRLEKYIELIKEAEKSHIEKLSYTTETASAAE